MPELPQAMKRYNTRLHHASHDSSRDKPSPYIINALAGANGTIRNWRCPLFV